MRGAGLGTAFGQERPTVKRVSSRSTLELGHSALLATSDVLSSFSTRTGDYLIERVGRVVLKV